MTRTKLSHTAKTIVARLRSLSGEARTYALQVALGMTDEAFDAGVSELVEKQRIIRVRGVGARLILA